MCDDLTRMDAERKTLIPATAHICDSIFDFVAMSDFDRVQDSYKVGYIFGESRECFCMLYAGEADMAIANLPMDSSKITSLCLASERAYIMVSADNPLAGKKVIETQDLADVLIYPAVDFARNHWPIATELKKSGARLADPIHRINELSSLVAHNRGVTVANKHIADTMLRYRTGMVAREFATEKPLFELYLMVLNERADEPGISDFMTYCRENKGALLQ